MGLGIYKPSERYSNAREGIEDGVIPKRLDESYPALLVELPPRMRTRRMYPGRTEVQKYGPTRGCPGWQKVVNGAIPSCIAATYNSDCRERKEKLMMQDPEGSDRVARTKVRLDEATARHVEEDDERAR